MYVKYINLEYLILLKNTMFLLYALILLYFSEYFTGITENGCPTDSHFLCSDNLTCIPYHNVCDISPDCPDETDETENCCKYNTFFQKLSAIHFGM